MPRLCFAGSAKLAEDGGVLRLLQVLVGYVVWDFDAHEFLSACSFQASVRCGVAQYLAATSPWPYGNIVSSQRDWEATSNRHLKKYPGRRTCK